MDSYPPVISSDSQISPFIEGRKGISICFAPPEELQILCICEVW